MIVMLPDQKERDDRRKGIATGGADLRPWWQLREFLPLKAGTTHDVFTRDDLADGTYEVTYALLKVEGSSVIDKRTYRFEVSGGEIVPAGRQVRDGTDPLTVIEGGEMDGNGHRLFFDARP